MRGHARRAHSCRPQPALGVSANCVVPGCGGDKLSDRKPYTWLVACCAVLCLVIEGHAQVPPGERGPDDPVWVQWMRSDTPEDQTILHYWGLHKNGELEPESIVDLGTMLFHRGFPNDAIRMYRQALKADSRLFEAWFRVGLVSYHLGEFDDARHAYKKCLKIAPDHGWCGFYLALLEEETGHPSRALELYRRTFESAPELADPAVNPEVLGSRLYLGALLVAGGRETGAAIRPMTLPESEELQSVMSRDGATLQVPIAESSAAAVPKGSRSPEVSQPAVQPPGEGVGVGAAPTLATVSPEASLAPLWFRLPEWVLSLV